MCLSRTFMKLPVFALPLGHEDEMVPSGKA